MINKLAKSLVLLHTILSLSALGLAAYVVMQPKDLGWIEPAKQVVEFNMPDVTPKSSVRHASLYDTSVAAYTVALSSRDRTYSYVQPAIEKLRATEPHLPNNTLYYTAALEKLRKATDKIEVRHLKEAGTKLDVPSLGKPMLEDAALDNIVKSQASYQTDLAALTKDIAVIDSAIKKIVEETKRYTTQLTGTDEDNKYIQPGLYQLIDLEYKAQTQLKAEIEDIKPYWSKAIERAGLYRYRRSDLESTLNRLKRPVTVPKADTKKL